MDLIYLFLKMYVNYSGIIRYNVTQCVDVGSIIVKTNFRDAVSVYFRPEQTAKW